MKRARRVISTKEYLKKNCHSIADEIPALRPILKQSNIKPMTNTQLSDSKSYGNGVQPPSRLHMGRTQSNNVPSQIAARPPNRQLADRMSKNSGEKTSVQSRLANVKKQISVDQIDFVLTQQPLSAPTELSPLNPNSKPFVHKASCIYFVLRRTKIVVHIPLIFFGWLSFSIFWCEYRNGCRY